MSEECSLIRPTTTRFVQTKYSYGPPVFVYPIPKCYHKKTVDLVNRVGFRKIYRQESTIILFHSCTDSSNVLCLSLLELEEHFGSDILDKGLCISNP